jgi:hypothetical protein
MFLAFPLPFLLAPLPVIAAMKANAVYAGDEFPSKGLVDDKAKNEGPVRESVASVPQSTNTDFVLELIRLIQPFEKKRNSLM